MDKNGERLSAGFLIAKKINDLQEFIAGLKKKTIK